MMEWTDRHCRYFLRRLSRDCLLYTEMVTTGAILHGDVGRLLRYNPEEHPLALQLGGSKPAELATCAGIGETRGYDEINLNLGCPSNRVQSGRFGACLMAEPGLVAECVAAMVEAVAIPVTVKTRIGIDQQDSYDGLARFIATLARAGCQRFIIHARKAFLAGLSPKENRSVPPLRYDYVYRLKQDFPDRVFIINGGITDLGQATVHLDNVDGVMLGREAYHNPWIMAGVDRRFFAAAGALPDREAIVRQMLPYIDKELNQGTALKHITRHMLGLYQGVPGARAWRRSLSMNAYRAGAGLEVIHSALEAVNRVSGDTRSPTGVLLAHG